MQSYQKMDDSMPLKICQTLLIMILLTSYLDNNDAVKAYRNRKSLLDSEHLSNVMTQNISNNIRYTFVRGYCFPEQRTSNKRYDVWVCLHRDTGSIVEGACSCVPGSVLWVSFLPFKDVEGTRMRTLCSQIFLFRQKR